MAGIHDQLRFDQVSSPSRLITRLFLRSSVSSDHMEFNAIQTTAIGLAALTADYRSWLFDEFQRIGFARFDAVWFDGTNFNHL